MGSPTSARPAIPQHRYYVSRKLNQTRSDTGLRIPAREVESLVAERVASLIADPIELAATAQITLPVDQITELHWRCKELEAGLRQRRSPALLAIVKQVQVGTGEVAITCDAAALAGTLGLTLDPDAPPTIQLTAAARLTRSGRALRLVQDNGAVTDAAPDRSLVRLVALARRWWAVLRKGEISRPSWPRRKA